MSALLEVRGLSKEFAWRQPGKSWSRQTIKAFDRVDLEVARGECLALVGESGCGKTTLARCILRLIEPDAGEIRFAGEDLRALSPALLRRRRPEFQMVFQDSAGALDPRMRLARALAEPLEIHRLARGPDLARRVGELLAMVGLAESLAARYPHELSGGQRQRVAIARALATEPRLLILDEPVSALDVSVQARILRLLLDLQKRLELTMIFISHDLAVVEQIADRATVLYSGRVVETGSCAAVFRRPQHPYTASLLDAVPRLDGGRRRRRGTRLDLTLDAPPSGCAFLPRCPVARRLDRASEGRCREQAPELRAAGEQAAACHFPGRVEVPEPEGRPS